MDGDDALSGLRFDERVRVAAMLAEREGDEAPGPGEGVGLGRRLVRYVLLIVTVAVVGVTGWHLVALASLPEQPFDGVDAPIALTIGFALLGILLLWWFDGRWRWLPLALLGLGALAISGLSMRWVDSSRGGVREFWAGVSLSKTRMSGDLCYRIDAKRFELRGAGGARFVYDRGVWPGSYSEAEFRRYFFSDLPMRAGPDGWTCVARS